VHVLLTALILLSMGADAEEVPNQGGVAPYPLKKIFRAFGPCQGGKRVHGAIDIGGVGPNAGLGTPIVSMVRSEVVRVGRTDKSPWRYGYPDKRKGSIKRGAFRELPRSQSLPDYGVVHYFTRTRGSWRTGNLVIARGLEPPLKDHVIRYMHLGAVHPDVRKGRILKRGQELGVMGGTAVMESLPHLHLDVTRPDGTRVDLMHLFGLTEKPNRHCLTPE
jgi:murein DD-endopeptidase MepM/ murein hydrolase activator NlpD